MSREEIVAEALTYNQAAAFLGISERTLKRLVKNDPQTPKPRAISERNVRFIRTELHEYLLRRPFVDLDEPAQLTSARESRAAGKSAIAAAFSPEALGHVTA